MTSGFCRSVVAAAALIALAATTPAGADDFYKGRQVRLIIGNNVGSSYESCQARSDKKACASKKKKKKKKKKAE